MIERSNQKVSVGLPTYNRADHVARAIDSVLAQTYVDFELIISDNASTDATQETCNNRAATDDRIRYYRQPQNKGAHANFLEVLKHATGEYFMWLADDDMIDADYILRCVQALSSDHELALVCGQDRYFENGNYVFEGPIISLSSDSPADRVVAFYERVVFNGTFYGVMRRATIAGIPFLDVLGGDWLVVGTLALRGKIMTLQQVKISRSMRGASQDMKRLSMAYGLGERQARNPHYAISKIVYNYTQQSTPFASFSRLSRHLLGLRCFLALNRRFTWPFYRRQLAASLRWEEIAALWNAYIGWRFKNQRRRNS